MTLIIETGEIIANAQSYVSATDLDGYATLRGITLPSTVAQKEALLIKAMDFLVQFANRWKGERSTETQVLDWPRSDVILYGSGPILPSDEIPAELKNLQMALAVAAINNTLLPTIAPGAAGPIIEKTVHGAVTVRYANPDHVLPVAFDATANALLGVLLRSSGLHVVRS